MIEDLEGRRLLARAIGIDVSEHNGSINWTSVKNAGINFAFIRATYGMGSDDATFSDNAPAATSAGVLSGYYHYAYYNLANHTPAVEANNFWDGIKNTIKADGKHLMPVLDVEEGSGLGSGTGVSSLTAWVKAWCADVTALAAAAPYNLYVVPLVYTSASPAGTYFDSTIPQKIPLWVANYTGTAAPQTDEPTAGTGKWQTWQFWQYTSTGSVPGVSGTVDRDVLNGDTNTLKDYIVTSTSAQPSGRFAVNTTVEANSAVFVYATLADARNQTNNYTIKPSGSIGTILDGPDYAGSYQRWQVSFKDGTQGYAGEEFLDAAPAPAAATLAGPANNAHLTAKPSSLSWSGSTLATSYDVYLDGVLKTNTASTSYSLSGVTLADGTHTWQARAKNSQGTTTGSTFTFILDTIAPTAALAAGQSPGGGASTFDFTVSYADATAGVDASTIGAGDVTVTGPNNFSQAASFVGYNSATGVATYRINAPGGLWRADASGTYTVTQNAAQVKDAYGNTRAAGTIGTFVANTIAYLSPAGMLVIDYGSSTSGAISLAVSGANLVVNKTAGGSGTASFSSALVASVLVSGGGAGGDTFTYNGPVGKPLSIALAGTNNTLNVASGTLAFASDVSTTSPNLSVNVSPGATLSLGSVQHLASLNVSGGSVVLGTGGSNTLVTGALSVTAGGVLDLADNAMVLHNGDPAALRTLIAAKFNHGAWNGAPGAGALTSSAAASDPAGVTALGYATNAGLGKTSFAGVTGLAPTDVLVRYTYYGDADLSGQTNVDDFTLFLNGYQNASDTWLRGDFDYSGQTNLDDFTQFLFGYQHQSAPL